MQTDATKILVFSLKFSISVCNPFYLRMDSRFWWPWLRSHVTLTRLLTLSVPPLSHLLNAGENTTPCIDL